MGGLRQAQDPADCLGCGSCVRTLSATLLKRNYYVRDLLPELDRDVLVSCALSPNLFEALFEGVDVLFCVVLRLLEKGVGVGLCVAGLDNFSL